MTYGWGEMHMETEAMARARRNYRALLLLWVVGALLLGVLGVLYNAAMVQAALQQESHLHIITVVYNTASFYILSPILSALLLFTAVRYDFWRCLPLLGVQAAVNILDTLVSDRIDAMGSAALSFPLNHGLVYELAGLIVNLAFAVAGVALTRLFATRMKREWAVVLCALAAGLVLSVFECGVQSALTFLQNDAFRPVGFWEQEGMRILRWLRTVWKQTVCTIPFYCLLAFLFHPKRAEKLRNAAAGAKHRLSKAWEASAK